MKPTAKLHLGDCLAFMKTFPDGAVDAVVTDPPYGIATARHRTSTDGKKSLNGAAAKGNWYGRLDQWDTKRPGREAFDEILRVSCDQVIFGGNYFADILPPSSAWIVWDKDNTTTKFSHFEMAWTSFGGAARMIRWRWNGMLQEPGRLKDVREHPTQKPTGLIERILQSFPEGCTVFDPFMGSGTTAVACIRTGRNFIGCEIDPGYFKIAERRVAEAFAECPQMDLIPA